MEIMMLYRTIYTKCYSGIEEKNIIKVEKENTFFCTYFLLSSLSLEQIQLC